MTEQIRFQHHSFTRSASDRPALVRERMNRPELPYALREPALALGPTPRRALAALADLGLTDDDIARYHSLSPHAVSELRHIWNIAGEI